jgi:trk/ktr system potassium uptake protein
MRLKVVLALMGLLLIFLGAAMAPSMFISHHCGEEDFVPFVLAILITELAAWTLFLACRKHLPRGPQAEISSREAFATVTFGWISASLFGALPFFFHGTFAPSSALVPSALFESFTNSFFETISGMTTTGASVLTDFNQPHGIMFWRSLTHWLGGMGIILLSVAILPLLGVGGMHLYRAEVPGPVKDRIKPRATDTAKILWLVYLILTLLQTALYTFGGMPLFDSLCHSFGTMATGGFSTKAESIAYYSSSYIHWVTTIFMILAGVNFALHYRALMLGKPGSYWRDSEFRYYIIFIFSSLLIFLVFLIPIQTELGILITVRDAAFQIVSIMTTTGFASYDYETWPIFLQGFLVVLMLVGGCAGSTGGSIKVVRIVILCKAALREIQRLLQPRSIKFVKLGDRVVEDRVVASIMGFLTLWVLISTFTILILLGLGIDFLTSFTAVCATLGNIGPGLGSIGPTDNYAHFPVLVKWLLSLLMLMGRLELYSVIILIIPSTWKR